MGPFSRACLGVPLGLLVVLVGAVACSDGSSDTATPTTVAGAAPVPTTIRYRGDPDSRFCRRVRAGIPAVERAAEGRAAPAAARTQARAVQALLRRVAGDAPDAVRSQVTEVVQGLARTLEILDRADGDPERIPADQQASLVQGAPVVAAGRVQAYARQVCGRPLPFLPG